MTDTVRFGRILGIPVGANWSILAVAALFTVTLASHLLPAYAPGTGLQARVVAALIAVIGLLGSILAHEIGHAVVAMSHGVGVWGISLWLLGGVARLDRQAPNPRAEFRIAVAGPLVSALLGVFFASVAVVAASLDAPRLVMAVVTWLAGVNLILAAFNLLPAAPLDGGRVLTAWLWRRSGDAERARLLAGRCGLVLSAVLVVGVVVALGRIGSLNGLVTALVGGFTFFAAREEIAGAVIRGRLAGTTTSHIMMAHPEPVPDTLTVHQLELRYPGGRGDVARPVVRWGTEPIGWISADQLRGLSVTERSWTQVHQVMRHPSQVHRVGVGRPLAEVVSHWDGSGSQILLVTGDDGSVIGTITDIQLQPVLARPDLWGRAAPPARRPQPPGPPVQQPSVASVASAAVPNRPPVLATAPPGSPHPPR